MRHSTPVILLQADPEARRFNLLFLLPLILAIGITVVFFLVVNASGHLDGTIVTPTPQPGPPVVHSIP